MKLIDKIAVVAEIETCYNECLKRAKIFNADYWNGKADAYRNMLVVLDTLEVKAVSFKHELEYFLYILSDDSLTHQDKVDVLRDKIKERLKNM